MKLPTLGIALGLVTSLGVVSPEIVSRSRAAEPAFGVSIDFPSGSGAVERIDPEQRLIRLAPTSHADRGWACWWYVKVHGLRPGDVVTLDVGPAPWATPNRAAFSTDNRRWRHTDPGVRDGNRITYRQRVDAAVAWFAWGPPFTVADAEELVRNAVQDRPYATAFDLCRSRGDRRVPAVRVRQEGAADTERVGLWIQARQHAWEAGSSWVCRGLLEWLVSDDPRAEALRKRSVTTIVPIMDVDNVAIGAGGKNEKPQDHNRDWSDKPHWTAVAAAIERIKELDAAGRFDLFIDLHNPSASDTAPYFYAAPRELLKDDGRRNLERFIASAQVEMTGPLAFRGKVLESGANYDRQWRQISKNWVSLNTAPHVVAVTLETAWNTPESTADGYRSVGRQLGLAIERYFRSR